MLKSISWSNYWIFITVILVGYYVVVCLKYYYAEIKELLAGKSNMFLKVKSFKTRQALAYDTTNNQAIIDNEESNTPANWTNEKLSQHDLFPVINQFVEEIKNTLEQAAKNNLIKQETIYALQQLAKKYRQVKSSPFNGFITSYILVESSNYGSIHLSEDDLNTLWIE